MNETSPLVTARFYAVGETLYLPSIALFELRFGVAASAQRERNLRQLEIVLALPVIVLRFTAADAAEADDIRAHLRRAGTPIGPYDVLIAAQARRRGATLVTANTGEFSRVPELALEDWTQP